MAVDRVCSGLHGARSTDHIVADKPNTAATANTADIADTEHPNMDHSSRGQTPALLRRGRPTEAKQAV